MLYLRLALLILFALSIPRAWNLAKGPSRPHLCTALLQQPQDPYDQKVNEDLSQSFSYWKKGSQFYAFLSADRRVVLKIPRASKIEKSLTKRVFKTSFKSLQEFLFSLKAVSHFLKEEAAILYVHYGQVHQKTPPQFLLTDRFHRPIQIDLNRTPFVLQQRKALLSEVFKKVDHPEKKKSILIAFLDLIIKERSKGWMCKDKSFLPNICYADGRAWRIDIGSYIPLKEDFSLNEATKPVRHWLKKEEPDLLNWFDEELARREFFSSSQQSP